MECALETGKLYLFMTTGFHFAGRLTGITPDHYIMEDCWMVSETGPMKTCLGEGRFRFAEEIGTYYQERHAVIGTPVIRGKKITAERSA